MQVREADHSRPFSLDAALADVHRLLLVPSSAPAQRGVHHNVISAAASAGDDVPAELSRWNRWNWGRTALAATATLSAAAALIDLVHRGRPWPGPRVPAPAGVG